jgi:hypothetical protein
VVFCVGQISILICKEGEVEEKVPDPSSYSLDLMYGAVNIHEWARVP